MIFFQKYPILNLPKYQSKQINEGLQGKET